MEYMSRHNFLLRRVQSRVQGETCRRVYTEFHPPSVNTRHLGIGENGYECVLQTDELCVLQTDELRSLHLCRFDSAGSPKLRSGRHQKAIKILCSPVNH